MNYSFENTSHIDNTSDFDYPFSPEIINDSFAVIQHVFKSFRPLILERAGNSDYIEKQTDGSPVTETDMEVEVALQAELARRFPEMPVFGEETGYGDELPAAFWLIDPIDGTKSFIEGKPTFTCMAVFIQDSEAIASVIYNPSSDAMYTAQRGRGAFKNQTRLDLSRVSLPPVAICKALFIDELNSILEPKGVTCEKAPAGGGFGFTMVLDGLVAARFNMHSRGYTHDYAPGGLLVREAGGVLLPILEDEYTYQTRSFAACHPELEATVRPHLSRLRKLDTK